MNENAVFSVQRKRPVNADVYDAIARHQPDMARALDGVTLTTRILRDGDSLRRSGDSLHIVVSGCLKKTRIDSSGDAHIDGFYYPGDLISSEDTESNQCSVITAYDTVFLASIPLNVLYTSANSNLSATLVNGLSEELKRANTLSFYVTKKSAVVRLAWFLYTLWSRNNNRFESSDTADIYMPMPRSDIASYLGLAAETVSRELTRLSRNALIAVDKRTVHVDRPDELASTAHINIDMDGVAGTLH